ncbi:hypothetical protein [Sorangium sp. So ce128]|uniref:hypothetical protein n=1 Tax=Sorangium sp. So ce128 TaxID=3133281 RepID=UPI003F6047D5
MIAQPLPGVRLARNGGITAMPVGATKLYGSVDDDAWSEHRWRAFWHAIGLCRFEPGELDPYLRSMIRLGESDPFYEPVRRNSLSALLRDEFDDHSSTSPRSFEEFDDSSTIPSDMAAPPPEAGDP